mgnify:FL=1
MIVIIGFSCFVLGCLFMSALRVALYRIDKMAKEHAQRIEEDKEFRNIIAERELNKLVSNG